MGTAIPAWSLQRRFFFPDCGLLVEIDGAAFHQDLEADQRRTKEILDEGIAKSVLRIRAAIAFAHGTEAVETIQKKLAQLRAVT